MNERQKRFCEEYMVDMCARRAALRAGYPIGTARNSASWIQPEHPTRPELRAEIDRMLTERAARTQASADGVVRELASIAFEGDGEAMEAKPERVVRELASIAFEGDGGAAEPDGERSGSANREAAPPKRGGGRSGGAGESVRMQDRLRALELLGKHLGLFAGEPRMDQAQPVIVDDVEGNLPDVEGSQIPKREEDAAPRDPEPVSAAEPQAAPTPAKGEG